MYQFKEKFTAPQSYIDQYDNTSLEHSKTTISPHRSRMTYIAGQTSPSNIFKQKTSPNISKSSNRGSLQTLHELKKRDHLKLAHDDSIDEERLSHASARSYERILEED